MYSFKRCKNTDFSTEHRKQHIIHMEYGENVKINCPCGTEFSGKVSDKNGWIDFLHVHFSHSNGFCTFVNPITYEVTDQEE
jgi:hypothetical protein